MKKVILIIIIFAVIANVSAQLKVNSLGNVGIGKDPLYKLDVAGDIYFGIGPNILGTTNNFPINFKVNGVLTGSTGSYEYTNVSFGYNAIPNPSLQWACNTAIGYEALFGNTSGIQNVATGYQALYSNTTGNYNTANGFFALHSNIDGIGNTAIGTNTLQANTKGSGNTAIGNAVLPNNLTGNDNTAVGNVALANNTGDDNTAIGSVALYLNTTGSHNTANGINAMSYNTTGSYNTAIGGSALWSNTTGSCNTAIGFGAIVAEDNLTNTTVIGSFAEATENNQVVIGNSTVNKIGGYAEWTTYPSDGRSKKNIQSNVPGLAFINRLQPVTYNLDLNALDELQKSDDKKINSFRDSLRMALSPEEKAVMAKARADKEKEVYSGFVAQDVEKAALSIGYSFNGVDVPQNGKSSYGLRYAEFVVPLVKAVQELSAKNDAKDAAIASLQEQVNELTGLLNKLLEKDTDSSVLRSENSGASPTGLTELAAEAPASLEQNVPNPFNHTTVIHYTLPETCTSAKILITNTAGRAIQQIPIPVSGGHDGITIKGGSLQAGVYLYSLICDGKIVDTKRMILTK